MNTNITNVTVIDSIMGSGKTSWAIQYMNVSNDKIIYITPYLEEITRIKTTVKNKTFYEPVNVGKGKQDSLKLLLEKGHDIATTHALFTQADSSIHELIKENGYTLILDEAIEVVAPIPIKKGDIPLLKDAGAIFEDSEGRIHWNSHYVHRDGTFDELQEIIKNNYVMGVGGQCFVWVMPIKAFLSFSKVFILTYIFEGQVMKNYFELYNIKYDTKAVGLVNNNYELVNEKSDDSRIKKLINILDNEKLNDIGFRRNSLSKAWYNKASNKDLRTLKNHISNFIKNITKAKSEDILWTTFKGTEDEDGKSFVDKLKGNGYNLDSCFAPCNARATNEYKTRTVVVYTVNRYINPNVSAFFNYREIATDNDNFALSCLLQWVFRSAIRDGKEINLYIPSRRMRTLLTNWINDN